MYVDLASRTPATSRSPVTLKRALLVDDITYNLEWMSSLLLTLGFESIVALNIAEAKKALSDLSFDVVFLDCELPDGFGYSLAAKIQKMELEQKPTIIGMTSSDDNEVMLHYFSSGAEGFIRKPIKFDRVCDCLRKCKLLDTGRHYNQPVRPKLEFNNLHFISHGSHDQFMSHLRKIGSQLKAEVTALVVACHKGESEAARTIVHRLLSLTPLLESKEFTGLLQSCQRVARWHDLHLLKKLGQAIEWEYHLIEASLQDELDKPQQDHGSSRKSA
jgi:CheY-like chemotaxis protein